MKYVLVLVLVLLTSNSRAQISKDRVASDSVVRGTEDSLAVHEIFQRRHPLEPFLQRTVVIGVTGGTPGGLNFLMGAYYDRLGCRVEMGGLPLVFLNMYGWQGNISYVLYRDESSLIEFSGLWYQRFISSFDSQPGDWSKGYGCSVALNGHGFFFEISAGHSMPADPGSHTFVNSLPMTVQIGYVH